MHLIAHRGNLSGPRPDLENSPGYINRALEYGFDVEVDVWVVDGSYFLGHDVPSYRVDTDFLARPGLWCHAKNLDALVKMLAEPLIHCFWHENDTVTLTSKGFIWTFPGRPLSAKSICVNLSRSIVSDWMEAAGLCTDYVVQARGLL